METAIRGLCETVACMGNLDDTASIEIAAVFKQRARRNIVRNGTVSRLFRHVQ